MCAFFFFVCLFVCFGGAGERWRFSDVTYLSRPSGVPIHGGEGFDFATIQLFPVAIRLTVGSH